MTPKALMSLNMDLISLVSGAQTVVALRLMGMSGAIKTPKGENNRMLSEKGPALFDSYVAGAEAALAGKRPDQIMSAAIAPLSAKVSANRKRLMR